jgi:hypothetical protein
MIAPAEEEGAVRSQKEEEKWFVSERGEVR